MFARICPCLVWLKGHSEIGLWMQIRNMREPKEREFLLVRDNLGLILSAIAEMSAGDNVRDKSGDKYIFGKPIPLSRFYDRFIDML